MFGLEWTTLLVLWMLSGGVANADLRHYYYGDLGDLGSGDSDYLYSDERGSDTLYDDEDFDNTIEGSGIGRFEHVASPTRPNMIPLPTPTFEIHPSSSAWEPKRPKKTEPLSSLPTTEGSEMIPSISKNDLSSSKPQESVSVFKTKDPDDLYITPHLGSGDGPVWEVTPSGPSLYIPPSSAIPSNTPPMVIQSIPKQLINAGEYFEYQVQENIFYDVEQEDLSLELILEDRVLTHPDYWIVLDGWKIIAYPSAEDVSEYKFSLRAKDYFNATVDTLFFVSVRQRQRSRNWNHLIKFDFGRIGGGYRISWVKDLLDTIKFHVGGRSLVLVERHTAEHPFSASFVNESLVTGDTIQNKCPVSELRKIYNSLSSDRFKSLLNTKGITLENVQLETRHDWPLCSTKHMQQAMNMTYEPDVVAQNFPPSIKNPIDQITGTKGEYLLYKVPSDFCYDPEEGDTRNLNLTLLNQSILPVGKDFWLQFDRKNQEFFGLPMEEGHWQLALMCADSTGKMSRDMLEVVVNKGEDLEATAEFSLLFKSVPFTPKAKKSFLDRLKRVFGDSDYSYIHVESYSYSDDHVLLKWVNKTSPQNEFELTQLRKLIQSDGGPPTKRLMEIMSPEFNVSVSSVIPKRQLLINRDNSPTYKERPEISTDYDFELENDDLEKEDPLTSFFEKVTHRNNLITYVIPSAIIIVMIIIAIIIACLLSRRHKSTQQYGIVGKRKEKKMGPTAPVIFKEELDQSQIGPGSIPVGPREPLIERAPAPPPSYDHSSNSMGRLPSYEPPPALKQPAFNYAGQYKMNPPPQHHPRKPPPYVPP